MKNAITSEVTKLLLILGAGSIGLFAVFIKLTTRIKGGFKPYRTATLLYSLVALLFFAVIAITAHSAFFKGPLTALITFQAYFLLLGITHFFMMRHYLLWSRDEKSFLLEMIFTCFVSVLGSMAFLLAYQLLNNNGLQYVMAGSLLFFLLPFFFFQAFKSAIDIPHKIIKEWFYPVDDEIEEPEDAKLKNPLVISFEFQKTASDTTIINFRAKAPANMEFGQLFYYFINDYNERHANSKVQFVNKAGKPHGWVFYKKPQWHTLITKYIDVEKTISNNQIKENDVIICTRSLV
jgi:hypothetical protein